MKSSYTKLISLCNFRLNLSFVFLFFALGCQLDQSVDLIKEKLFSENNEISSENNVLNQELDENEGPIEDREGLVDEEPGENDEPFEAEVLSFEKQKQVKSNELNTQSSLEDLKKLEQNNNIEGTLAFKEMGEARKTDSKIISFFTKFFDDDEDQVEVVSEQNKIKLIKPVKKKPELKNQSTQEEIDKEVEIILEEEIDEDETFGLSTDLNDVQEQEQEFNDEQNLEVGNFENDENVSTNNIEEIQPRKEFGKEQKTESLAFLQFKRPSPKKEPTDENLVESDNLVGLLLPLTGEKSAAGNLVINSLRYSMLQKPSTLNFKIFDTKGTPDGAVVASKQGISKGVKTFIGPIFSDETRRVKDFFKNKNNLTFFSLSPDLSNVSENVIVSGQNTDDQVSCIVKHLIENRTDKVLVVYHADKYGYVIRDSFLRYINNLGMSGSVYLDFFEVTSSTNLNEEIKKLSRFEERKSRLKNMINQVKADRTLEAKEKKIQVRALERKLTLDTPFDSIIVASEGDRLLEILSHLAFYDINSANTNIYGTSLWDDTEIKDNVFIGTQYVTSLKDKNDEFIRSFREVFSREPMSFNFHMHDLLELVQSYKSLEKNKKNNAFFYGEFSNSKINSGLLQREIFLKKIKKDSKTTEIFNCRLDVI